MKNISVLTILVIILTLYGQIETKSEENKLTINIETVNHVFIASYCSPVDSCRGTLYQLNYAMAEDLVYRLNKSKTKDSCIFAEEYYLHIYFKGGSKRYFRINGSSIIENNDRCFDIKDSDYFENLWIKLDKEWIELNKK